MRTVRRRLAVFERDIRLFMAYVLCAYLGIGVLTLILNLYLVRLGYDARFVGALNAVTTVAMGATCLGIGFLINRYGSWACLLWSTGAFAAVAAVLCFMTESLPLLLCAGLMGIANAVFVTTQMPFVIEWTPAEHRPSAASVVSSLGAASIMGGSLLGGVLPGVIGSLAGVAGDDVLAYRWTMLAGIALTATGLVPLLLMGAARDQRRHAGFQVADVRHHGDGVEARQARRDVWALVAIGLLLAFGVGAIEPFYNIMLQEMGLPASRIGLVFAGSGLAATLLALGGPALLRRAGPVRTLAGIRALPIPAHLALVFLPGPWLASIAYMTRRVSGTAAWPLESSWIGGRIPPSARAHAFGLHEAAWNFGFALTALAAGWAIAVTGSYVISYLAMAIFNGATMLVYIVTYGERAPVAAMSAMAADVPDPAAHAE